MRHVKFYVNRIGYPEDSLGIDKTISKTEYYGLFDSNDWDGIGNFCGWYGIEYYKNTNLLAYMIKYSNEYGTFAMVKEYNRHYDKIVIGSIYLQKVIEADSIEEAIEIFKKQYEKW